jgi:hypothetical protein
MIEHENTAGEITADLGDGIGDMNLDLDEILLDVLEHRLRTSTRLNAIRAEERLTRRKTPSEILNNYIYEVLRDFETMKAKALIAYREHLCKMLDGNMAILFDPICSPDKGCSSEFLAWFRKAIIDELPETLEMERELEKRFPNYEKYTQIILSKLIEEMEAPMQEVWGYKRQIIKLS